MTASAPVETIELDHFGVIPVYRRACPLCARDNQAAPTSRYSVRSWPIKECRDCGFVYIEHAPLYEAQFTTMAWERTTKIEEQRRAEIRPISYAASKRTRFRKNWLPKRTILRFVAQRIQDGNVIDLGCGDGQALIGFPLSFVPFGIEISSHLAVSADRAFAARGGYAINAACVDGLSRFPANFFAAASLRSYLEHEANPLPVLAQLQRILAPGAFAVVKVPNYGCLNRLVMGKRWCGFRYPDHLNYFAPHTLRAMASRAGFRTSFALTGRLPTSDNMWAVLTKQ